MSILFLLLVGFILSAFFSGVETGSYSLNQPESVCGTMFAKKGIQRCG